MIPRETVGKLNVEPSASSTELGVRVDVVRELAVAKDVGSHRVVDHDASSVAAAGHLHARHADALAEREVESNGHDGEGFV